ncbi:NUDIX domain-containing protein [Burkholderia pyrrocinia]|uniref:NUDIX domain-containing protein n=1 Tax=Burkholderia pyrrocinia TaxID=60550 RepID=UPI003D76A381
MNLDRDYPTPKLDVRALILDDDRHVLLAQESTNGRQTLPGNWCDINESPADAIVRDVAEKTGLKFSPSGLLALMNRKKHPHPLGCPTR